MKRGDPTVIPHQPLSPRDLRRVAAHATFEFLVGFGVSRTIAFELAWRMWGR